MPRKWTEQEDAILRAQVKNLFSSGMAIDWNNISCTLGSRSNKDCRKRWQKIDTRWHKGAWTAAEDMRLRGAVRQHGERWAVASSLVQTRSPDQCAKRWRNNLNPALCHEAWHVQADELLIRSVRVLGHNWKTIVDLHFPDRSAQELNNRYALLKRRRTATKARESNESIPLGLQQVEESDTRLVHDGGDPIAIESLQWAPQRSASDHTPPLTLSEGTSSQHSGPLSAEDVPMPWSDDFDFLDVNPSGQNDGGDHHHDFMLTVDPTFSSLTSASEGTPHQQSSSCSSEGMHMPWSDDFDFMDISLSGHKDVRDHAHDTRPAPSSAFHSALCATDHTAAPQSAGPSRSPQKKTLIIENLESRARAAVIDLVLNHGGTITMRTS